MERDKLKKNIQDKADKAIKLMEEKNYSAYKASKEVGIDKRTFYNILRDRGIWEEKEFDKDLYEKLYQEYSTSELNLNQFARSKGISANDMSRKFKLLGHTLDLDNKNKIDETVFDEINEESAYWIGLLLADGYINKEYTHFELSLKDKEHIEKFLKFLSSDHKIETRTTSTGSTIYRVVIGSKKLCKRFKELGITNNKTYNKLVIVDELQNKEIARHFIRGFIDGDGHILKGEIGITSYSKENLEILEDYICNWCDEEIKFWYKEREEKAPQLIVYADRKKLAKWLYNESNIYLDRKFDKYNEYYNTAVEEE